MKYYPTALHQNAAKKFVEIFGKDARVMSILLNCSCARGKASKDSCLDLCLILKHKKDVNIVRKKFEFLYTKINEFKNLKKAGVYSHIDLHITDGNIIQRKRSWTQGPDDFELEIGNIFIYSVALLDKNNYFAKLRSKYIPYYSEKLREKRLADAKKHLYNNLNHVPLYVKRGLYFAAFKRFNDASKEFLQVLFMKNRIYPISYDKWIKEQLVEILKDRALYNAFVSLYEVKRLESNELIVKANKLKRLCDKYLEDKPRPQPL
ncbi:MAG: hypothetical protein V1659_02840 [Candidatus Woesearchaeota archaeon]